MVRRAVLMGRLERIAGRHETRGTTQAVRLDLGMTVGP